MRIPAVVLPAVLLMASLCPGADDLDRLRDRQDRPGLDAQAAALQAAAEKNPNDPNGWYRAAIAYSYAAEVAMEVRDKGGAQRAAEAGVADADKAIELNGENDDHYRVLGTLCGQAIPANPIMGALVYGSVRKRRWIKPWKWTRSRPGVRGAWRGLLLFAGELRRWAGECNPGFQAGASRSIPKSARRIPLDGDRAEEKHQNARAREALAKSLAIRSRPGMDEGPA